MSLFLILALLLIITSPGIDALTSVFVETGGDVSLNVSEVDVPKDFHLVLWKFVTDDVLVSFFSNGESKVHGVYAGRIDLSETKYFIKLKNLQKSDSGLYTALAIADSEHILNKYELTVQDPVSPVELIIDSVSSAASSCNLTVTCTTEGSNISSTFRCANKTCLQEGGERSKVTKSGASLHVVLLHLSITCNHSNQVTWLVKKEATERLCQQYVDVEGLFGVSICLVKTVVFSVGLIIMLFAVIFVHVMENLIKQK